MPERTQIKDAQGRTWTISKVRRDEAEAEDFRFWYEELTPEQRVDAVDEALNQIYKTRGFDGAPRLRRVHRRIKRSRSAVSGDWGARGGVARTTARDEGSEEEEVAIDKRRKSVIRNTPKES